MSNKHPKDNKGNNIENQLINRLIIIFILLALLFLVISWILLYFLSNEALLYWGNLSSSLGFEILGVLVMYKFVSYMLRSDVTDQEKNTRLRIGIGILVSIILFWILRGTMKWEVNNFVDNSLLNLSVELGGALSLYFLFDQFLELIQKPQQQLNDLEKTRREKEFETLKTNNAEYRIALSELQERVHMFENLETRIIGILSEHKSYSRDEILRLINSDTFGKKYMMADVQSVLGKLADEEVIFADRYGEYLKKGNTNPTNHT